MQRANTPLALYLNVDFEVITVTMELDGAYQALVDANKITAQELETAMREKNNVVREYLITMKAVKQDRERPHDNLR